MSDHVADSHDLQRITTWWNELPKILDHLTLAEKLQLLEEVARSLRQPVSGTEFPDRQANLQRLRRELATLPVHNPADGFSNRNHDDALYGGRE